MSSNSPLSAIEQEQITSKEEEIHPELMYKDGTRLFKDVPDEIYKKMFGFLLELRAKHPSYRDDQLLMFMLCQTEQFISNVYAPEGWVGFRAEWEEDTEE